eukprot:gene5555-6239_t
MAMKNSRFMFIFILVLIGFLSYNTANALCQVHHPQTIACNAGFVIHATVLNVTSKICTYNESTVGPIIPSATSTGIPTEKTILLKLVKLFKGYKYINKTKGTLITISFISPYSIPLLPGIPYLLTGSYVDGKLRMNTCDWYQYWSLTTVIQMQGLRRFYWMFCPCKVTYCPSGNCEKTPRSCTWQPDSISSAISKTDCHSRFSVCMVKDGAKCEFQNPKGGKICL